ncbi:MAG: TRAP transporter large permease subunit, partial [Acidobacteriota bacterium]
METTTLYEESKGITGVAYWDNGFKLMSANKPIRDGGMAVAAILAAGLLSAVSGSSPATVVAIGSIMLPAMLRHGYPKRYAAGV